MYRARRRWTDRGAAGWSSLPAASRRRSILGCQTRPRRGHGCTGQKIATRLHDMHAKSPVFSPASVSNLVALREQLDPPARRQRELRALFGCHYGMMTRSAGQGKRLGPAPRRSESGHEQRSPSPISLLLSDSEAVVQGRTCIVQEASLASLYPKCTASIPSDAMRIPCACSWRTDRPPQPWRIAHSRTLRCRPTTCQTHEPAGLLIPPSAAIASCTRRRA